MHAAGVKQSVCPPVICQHKNCQIWRFRWYCVLQVASNVEHRQKLSYLCLSMQNTGHNCYKSLFAMSINHTQPRESTLCTCSIWGMRFISSSYYTDNICVTRDISIQIQCWHATQTSLVTFWSRAERGLKLVQVVNSPTYSDKHREGACASTYSTYRLSWDTLECPLKKTLEVDRTLAILSTSLTVWTGQLNSGYSSKNTFGAQVAIS